MQFNPTILLDAQWPMSHCLSLYFIPAMFTSLICFNHMTRPTVCQSLFFWWNPPSKRSEQHASACFCLHVSANWERCCACYVFTGTETSRWTLWSGAARRILSTLDYCVNSSVEPCDDVHISEIVFAFLLLKSSNPCEHVVFQRCPWKGGGGGGLGIKQCSGSVTDCSQDACNKLLFYSLPDHMASRVFVL